MTLPEIKRDVIVPLTEASNLCPHIQPGDKAHSSEGKYYCQDCLVPYRSGLIKEQQKHDLENGGRFQIICVNKLGFYTFGLARDNRPDFVILSVVADPGLGHIINGVADYLEDIEIIENIVISGDKFHFHDDFRIKVRRVVGEDLYQHFAFNRDMCPNKEWLQIQLPDKEMRLPGEDGFQSDIVNPKDIFEDVLDTFYKD